MQNDPTIDSVTEAFNEWRATRKGTRAKTPTALREQAVTLLEHHRLTDVIKALSLNSTTLKSWKNIDSAHSSPSKFVALPNPTPASEQVANQLQVTVRTGQGVEVTVSGQLSPAQLTALIHGLQFTSGEAA